MATIKLIKQATPAFTDTAVAIVHQRLLIHVP